MTLPSSHSNVMDAVKTLKQRFVRTAGQINIFISIQNRSIQNTIKVCLTDLVIYIQRFSIPIK